MKLLTVMFVAGVVDSASDQSVTVELASRSGCEPIVVVMPRSAFPCEVAEGDSFHLLKSKDKPGEPLEISNNNFNISSSSGVTF